MEVHRQTKKSCSVFRVVRDVSCVRSCERAICLEGCVEYLCPSAAAPAPAHHCYAGVRWWPVHVSSLVGNLFFPFSLFIFLLFSFSSFSHVFEFSCSSIFSVFLSIHWSHVFAAATRFRVAATCNSVDCLIARRSVCAKCLSVM